VVTYTWSGDTDTGRRKGLNEDAVLPQGSGRGQGPIVVAVADGLGGGPAGEVASRLAVESIATNAASAATAQGLVEGAHQAVADYILQHIDEDLSLVGMATTLTLARLDVDRTLEIGHVGDSRLYLFNAGELIQMTNDHTVAMDLVRAGELDPGDAPDHPKWHTMSNWIGVDTARIETRSIQLQAGDRVLACSDGLSNMISDDEIAAILEAEPDPELCVRSLIDAANSAGGSDNISVVLVNVDESA
jgi:protein phosphatase